MNANIFKITMPWGMTVRLFLDDDKPWLEVLDEDDRAGASTCLTPEALVGLAEHCARLAGRVLVNPRDEDHIYWLGQPIGLDDFGGAVADGAARALADAAASLETEEVTPR